MNESKYLKIVDEDGKVIEYEILCVFKLTKTDKNYIIYTDNTNNEMGDLNVYASIYYPNESNRLEVIETEEEWQEVEKRLKELQQ